MKRHEFPGYMPQDKYQWYTPRTYLEFHAGTARVMSRINTGIIESKGGRSPLHAKWRAQYERKRLYLLRGIDRLP
jgi:hypothetical protein